MNGGGAMPENVYEKLRELLDTHPVGCAPAPEMIEILKILFTEEEADVATSLGFMPFSVDEIAHRTGVASEQAHEHLESMANRGLVFAREKDGVWSYALHNTIQIFENPYRKIVRDDDLVKKISPLWQKYKDTFRGNLGGETTSLLRVVPVQKTIKAGAEILPYEKVYEMIDQARVVGISKCPCRESEQKCDAPREGCMIFGATCTYLVDRGFGRYITKDEMKQKLKEFDELGLVRQVNNTRDRLEILCNCCPCCCGFLTALTEVGNPRAFTRSAYLPVTDMEQCEGCGTCADERCPMGAREMVDERPVLTVERCIGCGACASGCPNDAIRMERSAEVPEPPENYMDLGLRLLQEKGKLEKFIEINTPKKAD
jgi:formate hydrogenlyase subunit 6/NADH:ubiquinone oxidoreductase subunit I